MHNRTRIKKAIPVLAGIALLWVPLLGDFHIESAILASLTGCFWAGWSACSRPSGKSDFHSALGILGYLCLVGLPLLIFSLLRGCFSVHGLAFWLLFPLPSVFFGYAIGRLARKWQLPARRLIIMIILLVIAVGGWLYEFFSYPQVYFFNHVWGGWPGPIYDETVTVSSATLFFRTMTLLWATLLWYVPAVNRNKISLLLVTLSAAALGFCYTQLDEMGVISPPSYLQSVLGGSKETVHFELYYDEDSFSEDEINLLALEHEFYFDRVAGRLKLVKPDSGQKIKSYIYGNPWQKKALVGARFTSYVPVWLSQGQLHIARQQLDGSLEHELVHVLARQFGNKLFNASWSIGLIEGLAVAVAGGSSPTTTIDQVVVSEKPYPGPDVLELRFSVWGFYGGRSGVNYTTSGSFVRHLLRQYPVKYIKEAYRTGNIPKAYAAGWKELAESWYSHLDTVQTDSIDREAAEQIFGRLSLFEKKCPHTLTPFAAAWDDYRFYRATEDTSKALQALGEALAISDSLLRVKAEWSYLNLAADNISEVQQASALADTTLDLQLLYADAFMMTGDTVQAREHLERAQELFNQDPDSMKAPAVDTRTNNRQWEIYRKMTYRDELPDSVTFRNALYRTKIRSLRKSIEDENWSLMKQYSEQLLQQPVYRRYFDDYLDLIHHTAFRVQLDQSQRWIRKLEQQPLRIRYAERLNKEKEWLRFLAEWRQRSQK